MGTGEILGQCDELLRVTCDGLGSHPGGVAIALFISLFMVHKSELNACRC